MVLDVERDVGGAPDVRPLVLPPVPDVQHRVPLLRHQPLRLVAVHEAHLRADGHGGCGGPPQGQAAAAPPRGAMPEPHGYPRTSETEMNLLLKAELLY